MNECMNKWTNEWMNKWMNEQIQSQIDDVSITNIYMTFHLACTYRFGQVHLAAPDTTERPVDSEQIEGSVADERSLHGLERSHKRHSARDDSRHEHASTW